MLKLFQKFIRTILAGIFILGLCLFPADKLPKLDLSISFADLIVHFIMFGGLGTTLYLDLSKIKRKLSNIWLAIVFSLCFGIFTELLQFLIVKLNRTGSFLDLLFDLIGAIIAVLFTHFIMQKLEPAA